MSLMPQGLSAYNFKYENWASTMDLSAGVLVTPGYSNVEGSWTQMASSSDIAQDCYWIYLKIHSASTASAARNQLLDIGVDPAGGTSYTPIIENFQIGAPGVPTNAGNCEWVFPFFIKAGSSVAVRLQTSHSTGTARVLMAFWGQPSNPENVPVGAISETLGTITNSSGQSFSPGNTVDGAWTDLGTTAHNLWWWQLGHGVNDTTLSANYVTLELAWGDASNKHIMFKECHLGTTSETTGRIMQQQLLFHAAYHPVPAGSHIYVRGRCAFTPDSGFHATALGIGG